jgi:dipeptidyl aminopeptidase/acylaminoacyl peptidase
VLTFDRSDTDQSMILDQVGSIGITSKSLVRTCLVSVCATAIALCATRVETAPPTNPTNQQSQIPGGILERIEKQGCVVLESRTTVCKYDYRFGGKAVEAISFRPPGDGRFPAVLLIPGYQRTAQDLLPLGARLAKEGFAAVAVSQPGFGKSQGPPDFVGPKTIATLIAGYQKLRQESFADPSRMAIYGYSRGGMAASLLVLQLDDVKAAVFGAGIYDFKRLYDESTLPRVRQNMLDETGMTKEAIRERSSILRMEQLKCPVLILHGGKDVNVPVSQALLLRDRLTQLHKEFEIKIFPDREHSIGPEAGDLTVDFFRRKLMPTTTPANQP